MRTLHAVRRGEAIAAYGGACAQCGTRVVADLMVVRRDGFVRWPSDVKSQGGRERYRWLEQNNWPDTFILACSDRCKFKLWNPKYTGPAEHPDGPVAQMIELLDLYGSPQDAGVYRARKDLETSRGYGANTTVLACAVRARKKRAGVPSVVPAGLVR